MALALRRRWSSLRRATPRRPNRRVPTIPFNSLTRESTALHEELKALGIVLLALQRLGQPTAIQQPIPSTSLCAPSLETSSVETSRRLPCRVLAGVTAGAAVSTYGVELLARSRSQ